MFRMWWKTPTEFKDAKCRFCKKKGRIERVCRNEIYQGVVSHDNPSQTQPTKSYDKRELHTVEETISEEDYQINWGSLRDMQIHSHRAVGTRKKPVQLMVEAWSRQFGWVREEVPFSPQLGGMGERCKLPQRGLGQIPRSSATILF